jgi:peptidoglycan/LPS O-acetylase OafA/YrhL
VSQNWRGLDWLVGSCHLIDASSVASKPQANVPIVLPHRRVAISSNPRLMEQREKRAAIPFIDVARALAPLFVLWAHLGPWWCYANVTSCTTAGSFWTPVAETLLIANFLGLNGNGGHLGVLLFFLVSGFIISHVVRFEGRLNFVIKRVFRLTPMLVVASIIAYILSAVLVRWGLPPTLGFAARSLTDLFRSIFLLDTIIIPSATVLGVTWSLVPEVGFYVLMAATWPALARRPLGGTYLMVALVALIRLGTMAVVSFRGAQYFFVQVEFILVGRAIYLGWAGLASYRAAALLASVALTTLAALHFADPYSRSELFGARSVAISWAIALALFIALTMVPRCPRTLRFLGDRSYSIYLLHIPVGSLVLNVLCLRYGLPIKWAFPAALTTIFATSHLTYSFVEVPAQRLGRKIASHWKSSSTLPSPGTTFTVTPSPSRSGPAGI